jgi:hypothetical protein
MTELDQNISHVKQSSLAVPWKAVIPPPSRLYTTQIRYTLPCNNDILPTSLSVPKQNVNNKHITYAVCQGSVYMGHKDHFPMQDKQNTDSMSQKWVGL